MGLVVLGVGVGGGSEVGVGLDPWGVELRL